MKPATPAEPPRPAARPTLRPYSGKDWTRFLALDLETAEEGLGDSTEEERATLRARWPAVLRDERGVSSEGFHAPQAELWVLEGENGEFLGHIWLTDRTDPIQGSRLLEVTTMGIVREARGRGYGRLLMQKAEAQARERGVDLIELSVSGNNRRARDLYRDLGYETTRRTLRRRLR